MSNSPGQGDGDELPFSGVGSCSEDINGATNLYYLPLSQAFTRDDDQLATNLHFLSELRVLMFDYSVSI